MGRSSKLVPAPGSGGSGSGGSGSGGPGALVPQVSARVRTLRDFSVLGDVFRGAGKLREAEDLYRSGLVGREKVLGKDHPETLTAAHNLALIFEAQRKFSDAQELYLATIEGRERVFGAKHPATCSTAFCFGEMLRKSGRTAEAVRWITYAHVGYAEVLGDAHNNTVLCERTLRSLEGQHPWQCVVN